MAAAAAAVEDDGAPDLRDEGHTQSWGRSPLEGPKVSLPLAKPSVGTAPGTCPCRCSPSTGLHIGRRSWWPCPQRHSFEAHEDDRTSLGRWGMPLADSSASGLLWLSSALSWRFELGSTCPAWHPWGEVSWPWPHTSGPSASHCREAPRSSSWETSSCSAISELPWSMSACGGLRIGSLAGWSLTALRTVASELRGIQTSGIWSCSNCMGHGKLSSGHSSTRIAKCPNAKNNFDVQFSAW